MYVGYNENENCWEFIDVTPKDIRFMFLEEKDSPYNFYKQDMFMALNLNSDDIDLLEFEGITTKNRLIVNRTEFSLQGVKLIIPPRKPRILKMVELQEKEEVSFDDFCKRWYMRETYASDENIPDLALNIKATVRGSVLYITQILIVIDSLSNAHIM